MPQITLFFFLRPGWLVRYAVGPFEAEWFDTLIADVTAGITVALTLIPQGMWYHYYIFMSELFLCLHSFSMCYHSIDIPVS